MKTESKTKIGAALSAVMILALAQQYQAEPLPVLQMLDLAFIALFAVALVYCVAAMFFNVYTGRKQPKDGNLVK